MRGYAAAGQFASGSMGPKVDAAIRFVESGGPRSIITSLERITEAIEGGHGTRILPDPAPDDHAGDPTGQASTRHTS
jgi:carbamate kinase